MEKEESLVKKTEKNLLDFHAIWKQSKPRAVTILVILILILILIPFLPKLVNMLVTRSEPIDGKPAISREKGVPIQEISPKPDVVGKTYPKEPLRMTTEPSTDSGIPPLRTNNLVLRELKSKNLLTSLYAANTRLSNDDADVETALRLYRNVLSQLSSKAQTVLDGELLRDAETDFQAGLNSEAVKKYRMLFYGY